MRIFKRKKSKSIKIRMKYIFIWMVIIMAIVFYTSFSMNNKVIKEYNKTMRNSIMLSNLSLELTQCVNAFENYIKNREEENYIDYIKSKHQILEIINNIEPDNNDYNSMTFLRNLRNMYEYHINLSNEIIFHKQLNIDTYNKLVELRTLFSYMNNHSQLLSTAYLDFSSQQHSRLLEQYKTTEENIYTAFIVFALISSVIAIKILQDILNTIDNLSKSAEQLSNANWYVPNIEKSSYKELDTLANAFNHMKRSIKLFIEELNKKAELEIYLNKARLVNIEKDKSLKESQLKALQAQMDPHFLFNTLNTVSRTAMFEGADKSVKLIESISKILRYNLTHIGKMVQLKEELAVLKAYAIIQQTRFQDQMTFSFKIEEDLDHVLIPPMIIQPVVENAIIHGLQEKEKHGQVLITIKKIDDFVEIKVEDNGKGMELDEVDGVFKEEVSMKNKGHSTRIGLNNIRKRLELHFNRSDLIKINSSPQVGTTVSMLIPLKGALNNVETNDC